MSQDADDAELLTWLQMQKCLFEAADEIERLRKELAETRAHLALRNSELAAFSNGQSGGQT